MILSWPHPANNMTIKPYPPSHMTTKPHPRTKSQLDPRLISTTTGSIEDSWHNCLLPFEVLASIIGLVTTSVAYAGSFSDTTLTVMGGVLLAVGLLGVTIGCIWQQYKSRKRCGSWTVLTETALFAVMMAMRK
uniref:Transmembrane protein 100 n=1 Tax=Pseudonaja textilis TaxID=8673 RepID=A0A670YZ31_PSETE